MRHLARSVDELVNRYIWMLSYVLFLLFIWLSLLYVIVVFTDLTAAAFVAMPYGPGVASSSALYLAVAVALGVALYRFGLPLWLATAVGVPLVGFIIWLGQALPLTVPPLPGGSAQQSWDLIILGYCFVASIIPIWLLLQPRGYLGAYFLYATFVAGLVGTLLGGVPVEYPASIPRVLFGFGPGAAFPIFPLLFTTIACGACSGFHGIVSSGTTSKQLRRETDARMVGYGGMLLEGFVAVVALATVMMLAPGSEGLTRSPDEIYAFGLARFLQLFGIPVALSVAFGKLAFATFIYDTLGVATRLGRYVFQELTGLKGRRGAILATLATLAVPAVTVLMTFTNDAGAAVPLWKKFWPVFGASNQMLAALSLIGITIWLRREGRNWLVTGIPALFMLAITLWSLLIIIQPWWRKIFSGSLGLDAVGTTATLLLALAALVAAEAVRRFRAPAAPSA
ncbi:MAG: carbon starvation CstA family protein [bacterium]